MAGSTYGNIFKITTWGESHGKAVGVVVDGCPAGIELCEDDIQFFLDRRKPGQSKYTTQRKESDTVEILSGVFEGKTTGTPISLIVKNADHHSADYSEIANCYRPGHADLVFDEKYGFRDYRGGGRSSGRETIGRVAAGSIASKILEKLGISIISFTKAIGGVIVTAQNVNLDEINENKLYMPNNELAIKAEELLDKCIENQDSCGGIIECIAKNVPASLGEPCFEKLDANLAKAVMSIGAVKAVEIGDGIGVSTSYGSINNDEYYYEDNTICKKTNHAGGIMGGISDGSDIKLKVHIKPTPSIARTQKTVNKDGENIEINIKGRHDPIIVPRAVVVVESMMAITLVDMLFMSMTSKIDNIIKFFS